MIIYLLCTNQLSDSFCSRKFCSFIQCYIYCSFRCCSISLFSDIPLHNLGRPSKVTKLGSVVGAFVILDSALFDATLVALSVVLVNSNFFCYPQYLVAHVFINLRLIL